MFSNKQFMVRFPLIQIKTFVHQFVSLSLYVNRKYVRFLLQFEKMTPYGNSLQKIANVTIL